MHRLKRLLLRPWGTVAQGFLVPLTAASFLYGLGVRARARAYRLGLFRSRRLPCRVISVGNLTVGGTGKTPMVIHLAELLSRQGRKVGIVSRGYGRRGGDARLLVSDGKEILTTPEEAGEEPYLMARRLPGVPVMVAKKRLDGGRLLCQQMGVDTLLLDDGFQHLGLQRDLDLLLIDATDPFGNGYLLPRGTLREPFSALSRAHAVVLTRLEQNGPLFSDRLQALMKEISRGYSLPTLRSTFGPTALIPLQGGEAREVGWLRGRRWFLFSGIGNPQTFRRTVEQLGGIVVGEKVFGDHQVYSARLVRRLLREASEFSPDGILTTEKDGVKVARWLEEGDPMWALRIEVGEIEEKDLFEGLLLQAVCRRDEGSNGS